MSENLPQTYSVDEFENFRAAMSDPAPYPEIRAVCKLIEAVTADYENERHSPIKQSPGIAQRIEPKMQMLRKFTVGWRWRDNHRPVALDAVKVLLLAAFRVFDKGRTKEQLLALSEASKVLGAAVNTERDLLNEAFPPSVTSSDLAAAAQLAAGYATQTDVSADAGQPGDDVAADNTIVWLGEYSYRIGTHDPIEVTQREHDVLCAFLMHGPTLDQPKLISKALCDEAPQVLRDLKTRYAGIFAAAIRTPGRRGNGSYMVRIIEEKAARQPAP